MAIIPIVYNIIPSDFTELILKECGLDIRVCGYDKVQIQLKSPAQHSKSRALLLDSEDRIESLIYRLEQIYQQKFEVYYHGEKITNPDLPLFEVGYFDDLCNHRQTQAVLKQIVDCIERLEVVHHFVRSTEEGLRSVKWRINYADDFDAYFVIRGFYDHKSPLSPYIRDGLIFQFCESLNQFPKIEPYHKINEHFLDYWHDFESTRKLNVHSYLLVSRIIDTIRPENLQKIGKLSIEFVFGAQKQFSINESNSLP
jgi:hypothetical protein